MEEGKRGQRELRRLNSLRPLFAPFRSNVVLTIRTQVGMETGVRVDFFLDDAQV